MQITFKLYAGLTQYLPHEARIGNAMPLELPEGRKAKGRKAT